MDSLSPSSVASMLKKCPRGQLLYDREPEEKNKFNLNCSSTSSPPNLSQLNEEYRDLRSCQVLHSPLSPLSSSLADVSSVLEDVSAELTEIQLNRVASVMELLKCKSPESECESQPKMSFSKKKHSVVKKEEEMHSSKEVEKEVEKDSSRVVDLVHAQLMRLEEERKMRVDKINKARRRRVYETFDKLFEDSTLEIASKMAQFEVHQMHENQLLEQETEKKLNEGQNVQRMQEKELEKAQELIKKDWARRQGLVAKLINALNYYNSIVESVSPTLPPDLVDSVVDARGLDLEFVLNHLNQLHDHEIHIDAEEEASIDQSVQLLDSLSQELVGLMRSKLESEAEQEAALIEQQQLLEQQQQQNRELLEQERKRQEQQQQQLLEQERKRQEQQQLIEQEKKRQEQQLEQEQVVEQRKQVVVVSNVSPQNAQEYQRLRRMKNDWALNVKGLEKDDKQLKFACQKAVTTPLNAISDVTCEHLKDKLSKLTNLLNGETVAIGQNSSFRASAHAQGINYSKNHLALKLISHGEEVVSSKASNAFAAAAIITSLWSKHEDFGQLFLAHIYEACPYLVPFHPPRLEGMSEVDHLSICGYNIDESGTVVEAQDKFLKRMSGVARLYAAVTISRLPYSESSQIDHPHGLGNVWKWLANVMNMNPVPDVTATLVNDVLEVTGSAMFEHYGKQFEKLLTLLANEYFQKIKQVTEPSRGGPVSRLELFLQNALSKKAINKPAGMLRADFL